MSHQILLVEDEKDITDMIKMQLESEGHQVKWIGDGKEALNLIQDESAGHTFSLFVLDRMLPGANGIEICKFIRMYKKTKSTPILMVTAMTTPEQVVEGLDSGADDYITKPFDMNVFFSKSKVTFASK